MKSYLPYADRVRSARAGWARDPVPRVPVRFSNEASRQVRELETARPTLRRLVRSLLSLDPRPAFQQRRLPVGSAQALGTRWGFAVMDLEVRWEITAAGILVRKVEPSATSL